MSQKILDIISNNDCKTILEDRLKLATDYGKQNEDNLWLSHAYLFPPSSCFGRVRTENASNLTWLFKKV